MNTYLITFQLLNLQLATEVEADSLEDADRMFWEWVDDTCMDALPVDVEFCMTDGVEE